MSFIHVKTLKSIFLGGVCMLLTSGAHQEQIPIVAANGSYELFVTGDYTTKFQGQATFNASVETSAKEIPYATLKLDLKSSIEDESGHTLGFFISKENSTQIISKGAHKITKDIEGFGHNFNGVFGFADIRLLGELPFFADEGIIQIKAVSDRSVIGSISVIFKNAEAKKIHLKGDFRAMKEDQLLVDNISH